MDLPKYSKGITSPIAILVGSVIIAVAILISGGVIQITPKNATSLTGRPAPNLSW